MQLYSSPLEHLNERENATRQPSRTAGFHRFFRRRTLCPSRPYPLRPPPPERFWPGFKPRGAPANRRWKHRFKPCCARLVPFSGSRRRQPERKTPEWVQEETLVCMLRIWNRSPHTADKDQRMGHRRSAHRAQRAVHSSARQLLETFAAARRGLQTRRAGADAARPVQ